ncbi:MAG: glycosyltransferase [Victivallaceae bacterium]|nr:glycosyltransferase [Victivallaceae bacterium]
MIKISVLIPVFNQEKFISECLDKVLFQTLKDIEIICVDDGSTDRSAEILAEYAARDRRLRFVSHQNTGVAAARNELLLAARGQFVIFLDPDDYYPADDVLESLYDAAISHKCKAAGGEFSILKKDGTVRTDFPEPRLSGYVFRREGVIDYHDYQFDYGFTRFIFDREMIVQNKIFFPAYLRFEDPPFFIQAMLCAEKFYALKKVVYLYRTGHKKVDFLGNDGKKLCGLFSGIRDCYVLAEKHKLMQLRNFLLQRILVSYRREFFFCNDRGMARDEFQRLLNVLAPEDLVRLADQLRQWLLEARIAQKKSTALQNKSGRSGLAHSVKKMIRRIFPFLRRCKKAK